MGIPTGFLWEWDGNGNENPIPTATLQASPTLFHLQVFVV